jgi:hypothetical protein
VSLSALRSVRNQYRGLNAHLHSLWQGVGRWSHFHNLHIGHLALALKAQLRPLGYTAEVEESLQVRRVTVLPGQLGADHHALTVAELLGEVEEKPHRAIAIYRREPDGLVYDQPLAWLELLTPNSKGETFDGVAYRVKRERMLQHGIVFVEMDYLHETPSTFKRLGDYTGDAESVHPYRIVVLDPRPDLKRGRVTVAEFDVDHPIPALEIPLEQGDLITFDFGVPYQQMFEAAFFGDDVDYRQIPVNFDRYHPDDQARIASRMVCVLHAARDGRDLEQAPFESPDFSLEQALAEIERLTTRPRRRPSDQFG